MYETLIASGASSELSNDNEEPELPIVDLLLQTTPPASPAKSTSPSLWDERTSDLPLISLGVVPASSVPLVTQMVFHFCDVNLNNTRKQSKIISVNAGTRTLLLKEPK